MDEALRLEKRRVRRSFGRAAGHYDAAALLQREICDRMLAKLDCMRLEPRLILDAGCGTGYGSRALLARYPAARLAALDLAPEMLAQARHAGPAPSRTDYLCGDFERLPLAAGCAGLVWSSLTLQWCNEPQRAFAEAWRALAPGGLFLFSTFGPDTLKELRQAFAPDARHTHVSRFVDMHDLGDLLMELRFAAPVMEMEVITVAYEEPVAIMRDLKAIGAHNATQGRARGLTGKEGWRRAVARLEQQRRDGRIPVTFEVIYGHAWKPEERVGPSGHPVIEITPKQQA